MTRKELEEKLKEFEAKHQELKERNSLLESIIFDIRKGTDKLLQFVKLEPKENRQKKFDNSCPEDGL